MAKSKKTNIIDPLTSTLAWRVMKAINKNSSFKEIVDITRMPEGTVHAMTSVLYKAHIIDIQKEKDRRKKIYLIDFVGLFKQFVRWYEKIYPEEEVKIEFLKTNDKVIQLQVESMKISFNLFSTNNYYHITTLEKFFEAEVLIVKGLPKTA